MKTPIKVANKLAKKDILFQFICLLCGGRVTTIQRDIYGCNQCDAEYGVDDCSNIFISTDSQANPYIKVGHIEKEVLKKIYERKYGHYKKGKKRAAII